MIQFLCIRSWFLLAFPGHRNPFSVPSTSLNKKYETIVSQDERVGWTRKQPPKRERSKRGSERDVIYYSYFSYRLTAVIYEAFLILYGIAIRAFKIGIRYRAFKF